MARAIDASDNTEEERTGITSPELSIVDNEDVQGRGGQTVARLEGFLEHVASGEGNEEFPADMREALENDLERMELRLAGDLDGVLELEKVESANEAPNEFITTEQEEASTLALKSEGEQIRPEPETTDASACSTDAQHIWEGSNSDDGRVAVGDRICLVGHGGNDTLWQATRTTWWWFWQTKEYSRWGDLIGGEGNDELVAATDGGGPHFFAGGPGSDICAGSNASDTCYGGNGDDELFGRHGNDYLHGGAGSDNIVGEEGDDELIGSGGDDNIWGGRQDDLLIGGAGCDIHQGEWGNDTVIIRGKSEVCPSEVYNGGDGDGDTLITAVPVSELRGMGIVVEGFENIVETGAPCGEHGTDVISDDDVLSCECDAGWTGVSCGCEEGSECLGNSASLLENALELMEGPADNGDAVPVSLVEGDSVPRECDPEPSAIWNPKSIGEGYIYNTQFVVNDDATVRKADGRPDPTKYIRPEGKSRTRLDYSRRGYRVSQVDVMPLKNEHFEFSKLGAYVFQSDDINNYPIKTTWTHEDLDFFRDREFTPELEQEIADMRAEGFRPFGLEMFAEHADGANTIDRMVAINWVRDHQDIEWKIESGHTLASLKSEVANQTGSSGLVGWWPLAISAMDWRSSPDEVDENGFDVEKTHYAVIWARKTNAVGQWDALLDVKAEDLEPWMFGGLSPVYVNSHANPRWASPDGDPLVDDPGDIFGADGMISTRLNFVLADPPKRFTGPIHEVEYSFESGVTQSELDAKAATKKDDGWALISVALMRFDPDPSKTSKNEYFAIWQRDAQPNDINYSQINMTEEGEALRPLLPIFRDIVSDSAGGSKPTLATFAVARDGKLLMNGVFQRSPVFAPLYSPETPLRSGSTVKQLTSAAIMNEFSSAELDRPLSTWMTELAGLPEFIVLGENPPVLRPITIRNVLRHGSPWSRNGVNRNIDALVSIGDHRAPNYETSDWTVSPEVYLRKMVGLPGFGLDVDTNSGLPAARMGDPSAYSNFAYELLGLVYEERTNQSIAAAHQDMIDSGSFASCSVRTAVTDRSLAPSWQPHFHRWSPSQYLTGTDYTDAAPPFTTNVHTDDGSDLYRPKYMTTSTYGGTTALEAHPASGAIEASSSDLALYMDAAFYEYGQSNGARSGTVLSVSQLQEMTTRSPLGASGRNGYGLGLFVSGSTSGGTGFWSHFGGTGNDNGNFFHDQSTGISIAYAANGVISGVGPLLQTALLAFRPNGGGAFGIEELDPVSRFFGNQSGVGLDSSEGPAEGGFTERDDRGECSIAVSLIGNGLDSAGSGDVNEARRLLTLAQTVLRGADERLDENLRSSAHFFPKFESGRAAVDSALMELGDGSGELSSESASSLGYHQSELERYVCPALSSGA